MANIKPTKRWRLKCIPVFLKAYGNSLLVEISVDSTILENVSKSHEVYSL